MRFALDRRGGSVDLQQADDDRLEWPGHRWVQEEAAEPARHGLHHGRDQRADSRVRHHQVDWTVLCCSELCSQESLAVLHGVQCRHLHPRGEQQYRTQSTSPRCVCSRRYCWRTSRRRGSAPTSTWRGTSSARSRSNCLMSGRTEELSHFLLRSLICTILLQLF